MSTYYFTFGQTHVHPQTKQPMKDYWVEIEASSCEKARAHMFELFGEKWGFQYYENSFLKYMKFYPKGCYARYEID